MICLQYNRVDDEDKDDDCNDEVDCLRLQQTLDKQCVVAEKRKDGETLRVLVPNQSMDVKAVITIFLFYMNGNHNISLKYEW